MGCCGFLSTTQTHFHARATNGGEQPPLCKFTARNQREGRLEWALKSCKYKESNQSMLNGQTKTTMKDFNC